MKRILLIGDSICMGYSNGPGYSPFVSEILAAHAVTARACADSGGLLGRLADITADGPWDVIHINCGLHDLKRDRSTLIPQTEVSAYAANVARICDRLVTTAPAIIWASITPVDDEWHQNYKPFDRRAADVISYNAAALAAIARCPLKVNDLHTRVAEAGARSLLFADGVHFTEAGSRLLARAVADQVLHAV